MVFKLGFFKDGGVYGSIDDSWFLVVVPDKGWCGKEGDLNVVWNSIELDVGNYEFKSVWGLFCNRL
ncbi:hypothetical protein Droror1_Dr00025230, partial [Drosera rotundifolia]